MADVKRIIETTLDRASGWAFGKYPSFDKEDTLYVNVQYPQKTIPSDSDSESDKKIYDFKNPNLISIHRYGRNPANILLKKDSYTDTNSGQKKASYRLSVRKNGSSFQAIETSDGEVFTQGNLSVLLGVMQDQDFGHYITFAVNERLLDKHNRLKKWDLNKMMEKARPSIGD